MLRLVLLVLTFSSFTVLAKPIHEYLPTNQPYLTEINTPESILGFTLGERHLRHSEVLTYLERLSLQSKRIKITDIGRTYQHRKQVLLTFSSQQNLANLENILAQRKITFDQKQKNNNEQPIVLWFGYGVHGDETSGVNTAMALAYYLAASQTEEVKTLLDKAIIVIEPVLNPDGMSRFVNWVDTFSSVSANVSPDHIEHHQAWPSGRTNHYWFDLNRDWLLLTQQETQNRLAFFNKYQPNIVSDYHEMAANKTYFFQPGVAGRTHPLISQENKEFTSVLASFHAQAFDQQKRLYFSGEGYDDFFFGKGSTYPDINGGIGILFEQASSEGLQQNTINGLLTLTQGIENNITTSLSTLKGAMQNYKQLNQYRQRFFQETKELAEDQEFDGYLIYEPNDPYRLKQFLTKLIQHQIDVFPLRKDFEFDDKNYSKEYAFYVPLEQPKYRIIRTLFDKQTKFKDNQFYDISAWTMPLAMNIEYHEIETSRDLKLVNEVWQPTSNQWTAPSNVNNYAYAFSWQHFLAPKLLNQLTSYGINARVATSEFSAKVNKKIKTFTRGSIIIPRGIQQLNNWQELLFSAAEQANIELDNITSGMTPQGSDLGSFSMVPLPAINVLLVGGKGVSQYEAGEVLYYLGQQLNIPVTVVEQTRIADVNLSAYSHMLFVDGDYKQLANSVEKITLFVSNGGVLFGQKNGAQWLADNGLLKVRVNRESALTKLFQMSDLQYDEREELAAKQFIPGTIFEGELDLSHPLTFGYTNNSLPLFRNHSLIIAKTHIAFSEVIKYKRRPLMSGYVSPQLLEQVAQAPSLVAHNYDKGRVIATMDNLMFRGFWLGSSKLLANSLFFAHVYNTPEI